MTDHAVRILTSSGWQDLVAVPPDGSGDATYLHTQGAASAIWTITHGLGKYPAVTTLDSTLESIEAEVDYVDLNTVRLSFNGPVSGSATLN